MMNWWNNGNGWDGYGGSWNNGLGMLLMMLIVWVPLIALGVWLVGRVMRPDARHVPTTPEAPAPTGTAARAILDRRFVDGELSAEEYLAMRRTLEQ